MIVLDVILNLSLLVAVSVLSGTILDRWKADSSLGTLLQGLLFGAVALLGMMNPFIFTEGVYFDGRSVVISICTFFFGPISGFIAMFIAMIYRIYTGGGGIVTGISVIISSYLIGAMYYTLKNKKFKELKIYHLYLLGISVHAVMLLLLLAIPSKIRLDTIHTMWITIIVIYPLATVLIGKILSDQQSRKSLLQELAQSEQQFRSLANNMNLGLAVHKIIKDQTGVIKDFSFEYINQRYEEITGLKHSDIIGKSVLKIFPNTSKKTIERYTQVALNGKPIHIESYSREKNIYFEIGIYKPREDHFAVILSDITERKKAERNTITQNRLLNKIVSEKDKLFSIVSHDLRSPMNGILGLTSMIRDEIELLRNEQIVEIAQSIHKSSESVVLLLNSLLEWSQLQRENYQFSPTKVNVRESIACNLNLLEEAAKTKKIQLINTADETHFVFVDSLMLNTIFRNLINNAIKFTPTGGNIEISSDITSSQKICVSIKDNGIGMNDDTIQKLFSLSGKINRKGTNGELSSGLGLIICKELIELNSGSIYAQSIEGEGTTFHVTFNKS